MTDEGKLFVGGLSFDTDDQALHAVFSKYGEVMEARVIKERGTMTSRGFGFVTFENPDDANDAMEAMNGQSLDGRQIRVDHAEKKTGDGMNRNANSRRGSGRDSSFYGDSGGSSSYGGGYGGGYGSGYGGGYGSSYRGNGYGSSYRGNGYSRSNNRYQSGR